MPCSGGIVYIHMGYSICRFLPKRVRVPTSPLTGTRHGEHTALRQVHLFERSNLGTNPGSFVFWKVEPGNEPGIFCFLKGWTWERTRDLLFFSVYLSTTHWATATQHMPLWRSQLTFNSNTDSANRFNVMPEIYTPFRKTRSQSYDFWIYNCICTTPAL
jgi:hypothetical protein